MRRREGNSGGCGEVRRSAEQRTEHEEQREAEERGKIRNGRGQVMGGGEEQERDKIKDGGKSGLG